MLLWEEEFCEELVKQVIPDARGASSCTHLLFAHDIRVDTCAQGFYVIRYDNRDIGLSSQLDE
jgi:hypothetical protein